MKPFRYGCVVGGENFCPRPELERQLKEFASSGQNLVIQGARRMGKTSLVKHAIGSMKKMKHIYIDLYGIRTLPEFCARVMCGVAKATEELSFLKKAVQLAFRLRPVIAVDPRDGSATISVDAKAASEPNARPYSIEFVSKVSMPTSSIRRIISKLVDQRIVYPSKGAYMFSNPFFREWLLVQ